MDKKSDMQAVIDAVRAGADLVTVPTTTDAILAPTVQEVHDLEHFHPKPRRKHGAVNVFDPASFNMVVNDNGDAGDVTIYVDRNPLFPSIVAVMNGHGKNGPGWGDFQVHLVFRQTPQWKRWKEIDGKLLPQVAFAEFVEDNLADIAEPPGAAMLEIATYLHATRGVDFKSALRLSNGQVQLQNIESMDAKVGSGLVAIPEQIELALAPFQGSALFRVPTRFRYRIQEAKLHLGIKMQRIEDMMRDVIDDVIARIERGTNISIVEGTGPPL